MTSRITHLVIQETSTGDTRYVCGFPSLGAAAMFRKECGRAGIRTSGVIAIPDLLRSVISEDDELIDALMMLLSDAVQADLEVLA